MLHTSCYLRHCCKNMLTGTLVRLPFSILCLHSQRWGRSSPHHNGCQPMSTTCMLDTVFLSVFADSKTEQRRCKENGEGDAVASVALLSALWLQGFHRHFPHHTVLHLGHGIAWRDEEAVLQIILCAVHYRLCYTSSCLQCTTDHLVRCAL